MTYPEREKASDHENEENIPLFPPSAVESPSFMSVEPSATELLFALASKVEGKGGGGGRGLNFALQQSLNHQRRSTMQGGENKQRTQSTRLPIAKK